ILVFAVILSNSGPPATATNAPRPAGATNVVRHSTRNRKPTIFHTAPEFITKPISKGGKSKKRKARKEEAVMEKKGKKAISKKAIKERIEKIKSKKKEVVRTGSKKGNDRLTPRDGIKQSKENPFFVSPKSPEYASFITNARLLIRAIIRGDSKELKRLMSSSS
ncbi:hypothetical protein GCK32_019542, partial [Trichostrongylus colubriformis]